MYQNFTKVLLFLSFLFLNHMALAQMSGTYTIDKTKSGSTNFKSFTGAIAKLNSSGVKGPVVFKVANDDYNEQIVLKYVSGSSTSNTITFEGADSSKVRIYYNCSQYESVIKVNAAANFVFKGMTIESTNSTYGYGIHITAGARNISLKNCVVKVASKAGVDADCIPVNVAGVTYATSGDNGENISVKNSKIIGGYFGVNIRGTNNSLLAKNFDLDSNIYSGQYVYCIYAYYAQDLNVRHSTIDNSILYYAYGIYTNQCAGGEIINNKIYVGRYALYLYLHNYYNRSDSLLIINNEISDFDDASYQMGLYSSYCYNLRIYHNTITADGTVSSFSYPCIYLSQPNNHIVVNNNFTATGNNAVFYLGSGTLGSTFIDNNNYHAGPNGGLISWQGTTYSQLGKLKKAVSSQNQHSTNEDPLFAGSRNLVPVAPGLNNRARKGYAANDLAGNKRPKAPDNIPDIGAYEYYVAPNDIDLTAVPSPVIAKIGKNTVAVAIKNNGSATYKDTVFVEYRINSGSWVKDTAVFSNLKIGETDTFYFTKKWNISSSGTFDVCATISPMVKSDPDSLVGDTICTTKCVGRSGTFVIDPSGSGDYKTISAAINSLTCGIAGPIKFIIKPGTYKERLTLKEVLGASTKNTITFDGLDRDKVTIEYTGSSSLPATVLLDDADYIIFKNVTIYNMGNQASCGFWLREDAHHNTIDSCRIILDSVTANYATTGILVANSVSSSSSTIPGNTSHNLNITHNIILGGSHGIRVNGSGTSSTSAAIQISNNHIRNYYYEGINCAYISESKVRHNTIKSPRVYTAFGLSQYYSNNDSIDNNYVEGGRYGIYLYYENGYNQNNFTSLANNMVTNLLDPNYQIGIYAYAGYNLTIYHNSVWTTHSFSNAYYASMNLYYCNNSFVKNNSFKATNGGMCFSQYYGTISIGAVDYNNYYCTGAAKYYHDGLTFTDLKTWKAIKTQFNINSKEGDPNYNSITDLHVTGSQLNNGGLKGTGITRDIDGQKRPFAPDKKVDIGADEYYVSPYDIDLLALDSPIVPVIGENEISLILRNTGIKSLSDDTVVVSYTVDGTVTGRDTVIISSLAPNTNYYHTFTDKWKITTGKTYQLCAVLDTVFLPDPDSLVKQKKCMTMCPGAKGKYVIDKTGAGDFKTFRGAINALGCGISGPVTFTVKNGTYNERINLGEITGASAKNQVSFVGESTNGVKVHYTGRYDSMEVVRMTGTDYVNFTNIHFKNFSSTYSRGVWISNIGDHNSFNNCYFDIPIAATNGYCMPVYISDENLSTVGNAGNYNVFNNCTLRGGYYGARLYGIGTTSLNYGNTFTNCTFVKNRVFGVYAIYQGELNISNCSIDSLRENYYDLYIYLCSKTNLEANILKTGRWGLYLLYENYYFQEETSLIANNMVSNQSYTVDNYGMDIYLCYNTKIFHNSLMMSNGNSGAVLQVRYGSGHDLRNNSLSKSTNADLFVNTSTSFTAVDFNNYYKGSSSNFVNYNGTTYDNLNKWKTAVSGFNRNSKEGDPGYRSSTDLSIDPKSTQLANWGSVTTGITTDYEGDIRNPKAPDVGADEYSDLYDIGVSALLAPSTGCALSNSENIKIRVKNEGSKDIPSGQLIPVGYSIDGKKSVTDTFYLSSNLKSGATIDFSFATKGNFSTYKNYQLKTWTNLSNDSTRKNDTLTSSISSFEYPKADFSFGNGCTDEDITFSDKSTISTGSISAYKWTFGNGKTSKVANPKTHFGATGSYSVKLVVTSSNGCKDSVTKSIDINQKPTAGFSSASLCFGDSASFTNTSSIATATGASFNWNFDDGNTSTKRSAKNKYSSTGSYNVSLEAISSDGCKDTVVNSISISPNPVASFTKSSTCKGDTSFFTNTSNVPSGFTPTYKWSFGDGSTSTDENPKYVYGAIGSYKVSVTASLTNGCYSSNEQTIHIYSKPQPAFSANNGCDGDSIAFTNNSVIQLDTISTYNWQFGDGNTNSKKAPKHLYSTKGSYSVKLILTSVKGCVDSVTNAVTVYEKPKAAMITANTCEGDTSYFTNNSSIGSGSISNYGWYFGDGFTSTDENPKHVYGTYGSYVPSLVVSTANGCTDSVSGSLAVNASPVADFSASNVCFGDALSPGNNSSIASGSISSYYWDFDDGTSSTAKSPSHTYTSKGNFDLKLVTTSNSGCKDSLTKQITVDSKMVPGYNATEACLGDSTRFTNTTNTSCGSVSGYKWFFGDGTKSTRKSPGHKYASAGSYNVKLVVYQAFGVKDSITKTVVVNGLPKIDFAFNNACKGVSTSFTNKSSIASGSINGYTWHFGDGVKSSLTNPSHSYSTKGSYSVKLIGTSNKGCRDSSNKSITIYEQPVADFSVANACLGSAVKFTNKSSISSGTLSYSWKFGDGFSSTQTSPSYTYASSGTYTVQLTVTSTNGCIDVISKSVTIHPKPSAGFSASNQCANKSISFSNSSTISSGTLSYLWRFGDKTTSTAISPSHLYGSPGTYSVTLINTSDKGCVDSVSKNVSSLPTPVANFTVPSPCSGTKLSFSNASTLSSGTLSYQWSFGDGGTSANTNPTHTYSSTGTYTVKLLTTASSGCKDSVSKVASVYDLPSARFSVSGKCLSDSIGFTNTSTIASGTMQYKWSMGDGSTYTKKDVNHLYSATGTYQVKLVATSNGGCKDSSTQTINVYPAPTASFTANDVCLGGTTVFANRSSIATGSVTYFWDFDNGSAGSVKNPSITYNKAGSYSPKLIVTSNNGCVDSISQNVQVFVNPKAAFAYSGTCLDDTTIFTNGSSITTGSFNNYWDFDDGNTAISSNAKNRFANTGSYLVQLITTSTNGCKDTARKVLIINPKANAKFATANVCLGNKSLFTNQTTLSKGSYSNAWKFGDGGTSAATNPQHLYKAAGTYVAELSVTTDSGCVSTVNTVLVVNDKPTAGFNTADVCRNASAQFNNTSSIGSGKISTYNWKFGDGFQATTTSPSHNYSSAGTYGVQLIIASDSGCSDTITKNIQVYPVPKTAFSVSNVCFGDTLYPKNSSTIGSGSISKYQWYFGDGATSTAANPLHYYSSKGTFSIKLRTTSNNGCVDSLSKNVTVDNVIVPGFNYSNVCLGEQANFNNTTNASCGNISSYQWQFGDGNISGQTSPTHTYASAGSYNVQLVVTEKSGRKDTLTQQITVYPKPVVAFAAADTCAQSNVRFTNKSSIASGSISNYVWSFGDGSKGNGSSPSHSYALAGNYNVKLVATSNNACKDSSTYSGLQIFELPKVSFSASASCIYDSVAFTNNSVISSGSLSYKWSFGDGNTSTVKDEKHLYASAGNYVVSLQATSNKGCVSTKNQSVYVNYKPMAAFTTDTVCAGNNNTFTNKSSVAKGSIKTYKWSFGDGFTSTNANESHKYANAGFYTAQLIVATDSGCTDTMQMTAGVNPNPKASFTASNVCLGDDLSPTNKSSISSGSIAGWKWNFGDGNTATSKSPTNKYLSKGSYTIKLVATSDKGCKDSTTQNVAVDNVVKAGFNTSNICLGDTAFFTNTSSTSCGTVTGYKWTFGDGAASTTKEPFRIYKNAGTYTVQLIVLQSGGNADTITHDITVSPKPKVGLFANSACEGEQIQFQNLSTISSGSIATYEWKFGDGKKSSDKNPKYTYANYGSFNVTLVAVSSLGCIDSTTSKLDIYEVPTVAFTANDVCFGASVDFKNGSSISTGSVNYNWNFGDGFSSTQKEPIYKYAKAGTYTVDLKVTSNKFCEATLSKKVKVNELPKVDFAANDTCAGDDINFKNNSTIGSGLLTYKWTLGDGSNSTLSNPSHAYATSGNYSVKLKAMSTANCADSLTKTVSAFANPSASFTYNGSCPDKPVSFSSTSTSSNPITNYDWLFNGNDAKTGSSLNYQFSGSGPHSVLLTVKNGDNCIDTAQKTIVFQSVPVANFDIATGCERDTTYFTNKTTLAKGKATYVWKFGDGATATSTDAKHLYSTAQNYDVKLLAISDAGCRDSLVQSMIPYDKPEVGFTANGACLGDTSYFSNTTTNDAGNTYYWSFDDAGLGDNNYNTKHLYSKAGSYNVQLKVSNANCSDSVSNKISVAVGPQNLDFSFSNACARSKVTFNNKTTNPNLTFKWLFFDGSFSTQKDPTKYYAKAGKYPVGFEAREGDCADSTYKVISIYPYGDSTFSFTSIGNRKIGFAAADSSGSVAFAWDFGDGDTSMRMNPSHQYSSDGTYKVVLTVTTENGCANSSQQVITVKGTSVSWQSAEKLDVSVYPNPFTDFVNAAFELKTDGMVRIEVYNEIGQLVNSPIDGMLNEGKHIVSLLDNTTALRSGVYFVKIQVDTEVVTKRILLTR
ncbi:PKD domain-containing protein [bacterium]|nr:PKD domain-containing protein [bacterium]